MAWLGYGLTWPYPVISWIKWEKIPTFSIKYIWRIQICPKVHKTSIEHIFTMGVQLSPFCGHTVTWGVIQTHRIRISSAESGIWYFQQVCRWFWGGLLKVCFYESNVNPMGSFFSSWPVEDFSLYFTKSLWFALWTKDHLYW